MKKIKALLSFTSYSPEKKITFGRNVLTHLTDNSNFATPDKSLADIKASVDTLEKYVIESKDGSNVAKANLRAAEIEFDDCFRDITAYVNRIAKGDAAIILSAGMILSAANNARSKPEIAAYDGDHSGTVIVRGKAIKRARAYIFEVATSLEGPFVVCGYSTASFFIHSAQAPASIHYYRMAGITPSGVTNFTSPVLKVVQ